jgi:hypothetical protein
VLQEEAYGVSGVQQQARQMPTEQGQRHIEGLDLGLRSQVDLASVQQLRQDQAGPDLLVDHSQFGTPQQAQPQVLFEFAKGQFNGTITNDKFCLSRMGRLHLSWWRLPLRARIAVTKDTGYPSDANEMERCHQEGTHEETCVDHPASHG